MILDIMGIVLAMGFIVICLWGLYNMPILIMGIKDFRKNRQQKPCKNRPDELLPTVSIVLPVKNEENVIGTLLDALSKLNYPANKKEIIVVDDGSTDDGPEKVLNFKNPKITLITQENKGSGRWLNPY